MVVKQFTNDLQTYFKSPGITWINFVPDSGVNAPDEIKINKRTKTNNKPTLIIKIENL